MLIISERLSSIEASTESVRLLLTYSQHQRMILNADKLFSPTLFLSSLACFGL